MKLEKKHWIIIGVVVAIIAVWYFFLRKKKTESAYVMKRKPLLGTGNSPYNPNRMTAGSAIVCPPGFVMQGGKCVLLGGDLRVAAGTRIANPMECPCADGRMDSACCNNITQKVDPGPGGFGGGSVGNWGSNVKH